MIQKFEKFEAILAKIQSIFFCIVLGFMAIVMFASVHLPLCAERPHHLERRAYHCYAGRAGLCRHWLLLHYKAHTPRAAFPR